MMIIFDQFEYTCTSIDIKILWGLGLCTQHRSLILSNDMPYDIDLEIP